jgi:hypothetical protein
MDSPDGRFSGEMARLVDGEGDLVVLETFGRVDKVGKALVRWHAWSATTAASRGASEMRLKVGNGVGCLGFPSTVRSCGENSWPTVLESAPDKGNVIGTGERVQG